VEVKSVDDLLSKSIRDGHDKPQQHHDEVVKEILKKKKVLIMPPASEDEKEEKEEKKEEKSASVVANSIESEIHEIIDKFAKGNREAWIPEEYWGGREDEFINDNFGELLEEYGGGYADYEILVDRVVKKLKKHYTNAELVRGMKYLEENSGYSMFDNFIEGHSKKEEPKNP